MKPEIIWFIWLVGGAVLVALLLRAVKLPEVSGWRILFSGVQLYLDPSRYVLPRYKLVPASLLVAVPLWAALGLWLVGKLR